MLLVQLLIGAIAQGCVYGLAAMGIVLMCQASKTISLAQGEWMLLGAWLTLVCSTLWDWPYWAAGCAALVLVGVLTWVLERMVMHPLRDKPTWALALLGLGLAFGVRTLVVGMTNTQIASTSLASPFGDEMWTIGNLSVRTEYLAAIGITAVLCTTLYGLFRFSKVGFALHAALHNRQAASHMGLPVRLLDSAVWVVAALLAVVAGLLLATWTPVDGDMALTGFKALSAALLGGLFHLRGAMLAGIAIGMVEAVANVALPQAWQDSPAYVMGLLALPFIRRGGA